MSDEESIHKEEKLDTNGGHTNEIVETNCNDSNDKNGSHDLTHDNNDNNDNSNNNTQDNTQESITESEAEEDEPPKLKYSRITQLPPNFFTKDPVSSCFFQDKFFIFATHSGIIHLCKSNFEPVRTFKAHRASVLSTFIDGQFFASGSIDGTVVIGSILDEKDIIAYDFQRPIHCIVLDSNFSNKRSFITGGMSGKIIYSSKNWLGKKTDYIIDQNNGPIVGLTIIDDLIIWMNDKGINVFHLANRSIIKILEKPKDSARNDLYWPRYTQPDPDRLIIAWSNYIWSLRISLKTSEDKQQDHQSPISSGMSKILPSTASISFRNIQEKKIEIEQIFKLNDLICGIASFKDDLWMVLTYNPPTNKKIFNNPDLKLINSMNGEIEFEEELGLKNVDNLGLNDFYLGFHIENIPKYFIISAKDGVLAQEFQINDRLNWYLEKEDYLRAFEISEHLVDFNKRLSYGIQYVDSLMKDNEWEKASEFLKILLPVNIEEDIEKSEEDITKSEEIISQWQTWSNIFINSNHVKELTNVLPQTDELSKEIYNNILLYWIVKDTAILRNLISEWDIEIYDFVKIELKLIKKQDLQNLDENIENSLIIIYNKSIQPIKAVKHLYNLKNDSIIEYCFNNHILQNFITELPEFIKLKFKNNEINTLSVDKLYDILDPVITIFIDLRLEILPQQIIEIFKNSNLQIINYFYLNKLKSIDNYLIYNFQNEIIQLYCEFNKDLLYDFLISNNNYNIEDTIKLCENNEYYKELIYLLGLIGENQKALNLVITKLNNPEMAFEYVLKLNDKEVWKKFITQSITRFNFLKILIEKSNESTYKFYDPITILTKLEEKINDGNEVVTDVEKLENEEILRNLKQSIIEFSKNNQLNKLIQQIILKLIYKQSQELSIFYKNKILKGIEVENES
ncbi:VPS41 [Candida pseudojiufengensis]|uniref:VPS41 n=1 Tax=Candida pseudojiufengensis TaxID=497109 RepID=UPI0022259C6D|nr:VPS41 [Candida pseudojiufengensis]KAI5962369.1 VPS41 [Candida pseudojiufengensis]